MKNLNIRSCTPYFLLLLSIVMFIGFGIFHITKFETVDEHFWKYGRVANYFVGWQEGLSENNWKETRINDKPGVTTALISGIGMQFGPNPLEHRDAKKDWRLTYVADSGNVKPLYESYKTELTSQINLAMRLPLILFNGLVILPLFFFLLRKYFRQNYIVSIATLMIGMSPVLIGISQIINPDAMLWAFTGTAILAYAITLKNWSWRYTVLTGVLTGFALLSKYTANLLFLFYPILFALSIIFREKAFEFKAETCAYIKHISTIIAISFVMYALFIPYTLVKIKHFLYGTINSPTLEPLVDISTKLLFFPDKILWRITDHPVAHDLLNATLSFGLLMIVVPLALIYMLQNRAKYITWIMNTGLIILICSFVLSILNANLGTFLFGLDDLKEISSASEKLSFPQFADDPALLFHIKAFLVQTQNFIFSVPPITLLLSAYLWIRMMRDVSIYKNFRPMIYLLSLMPFVFFLGGILADIFVNIRYSIMLYTGFAVLSAVALHDLAKSVLIQKLFKNTKAYYITSAIIVFCLLCVSLWQIKPHFFNYHSSLLPKEFVVTDSWGYGSYEAAEYLNALPDAENLTIWTDRRPGACQFFVGNCITARKIQIDHTNVDYFVFSRRGWLRKHFATITKDPEPWIDPSPYYLDQDFLNENEVFRVNIGDRYKNYVRVIKATTSKPDSL